jgi:hypothetical protein
MSKSKSKSGFNKIADGLSTTNIDKPITKARSAIGISDSQNKTRKIYFAGGNNSEASLKPLGLNTG